MQIICKIEYFCDYENIKKSEDHFFSNYKILYL